MIVVSNRLLDVHPEVFNGILDALIESRIQVEVLDTKANVWLRDFLPLPTAGGRFTKFRYHTVGYDEHSVLQVPANIGKQWTTAKSKIALDGGNVVQTASHAVITERVFTCNPEWTRAGLERRLERIFGKPICFLPVEPGDELGHADGILHFFDEHRTFVNDYSTMKAKVWQKYQGTIERRLGKAGIEPVWFPYAYHRCPLIKEKEFRGRYPHADDFNPAVGYYVNMLIVGNVVLLPVFGFLEDAMAEAVVREQMPKAKIYPINCLHLAMTGGLLNCCTWEAP